MKFKLVTGSPIHSHSSLPHDTTEAKSSEGLKIALKVWPSIQDFNIELVIFKEDFGRGYKSSCARRVFDLTPSWFLLSEVWSMSHSSHWHTAEPQGVFRTGWTFSRASRIKWGQKIYGTCASLGSSSVFRIFANTFALQAGIEDFKFTNVKKEQKPIPGNTGLKAHGVSVALL